MERLTCDVKNNIPVAFPLCYVDEFTCEERPSAPFVEEICDNDIQPTFQCIPPEVQNTPYVPSFEYIDNNDDKIDKYYELIITLIITVIYNLIIYLHDMFSYTITYLQSCSCVRVKPIIIIKYIVFLIGVVYVVFPLYVTWNTNIIPPT